ncbi:DNA phosphorothioation-associated putative methyltransferase [Methylobacterium sp. D53M]
MARRAHIGKHIGGTTYLHREAVDLLRAPDRASIAAAEAKAAPVNWNVAKVGMGGVSLLLYEDFDASPFPRLLHGVRVTGAEVRRMDYSHRANPPILHRKEHLLRPSDPRIPRFTALTVSAEERGLFADPRRIGTVRAWEDRLERAGLRVEGHALVEIAPTPATSGIARHKTALARNRLSTPMQALTRHGFVEVGVEVLDYGCGQGDDVRALVESGVAARGWDPHFLPDADLEPADTVNLGFVLNVIERPAERLETLRQAWSLCRRVLAVAVMVAGHRLTTGLKPYGDGYLTSRGTFQRYFTPDELREIVGAATGVEAVAVAHGVMFAFRHAADERDFLYRRQVQRVAREIVFRPSPRERAAAVGKPLADRLRPALETLWGRMLCLGRPPSPDEIPPDAAALLKSSNVSLGRAVAWCEAMFDREAYAQAACDRRDDLTLYFALGAFTRSAALADLADSLRRDAKAFFGSIARARKASQAFLFSLGDTARILEACDQAVAQGLAHHEKEAVVHFRGERRHDLPLGLRGFLGCASVIFGDLDDAEILRVNSAKGTLSLYFVRDFDARLPQVTRIVRVDLGRQTIRDRTYEGAESLLLVCRSAYAEAGPEREDRAAIEGRAIRLLNLPSGTMTVRRYEVARALQDHPVS